MQEIFLETQKGNYNTALLTMGQSEKGPLASTGSSLKSPIVKSGFVSATGQTQQLNKYSRVISPEQEAEYRMKNLCFYCHKKFSWDHKCPQRQQMQIHYIEDGLLRPGLAIQIEGKQLPGEETT